MEQKDSLVNYLPAWVIPREIKGDQMGNKIVIISDIGPRFCGYLEQWNIDQVLECDPWLRA